MKENRIVPYNASIRRTNPTCFMFLIDQSASMSDPIAGQAGTSKAQAVADAVNRLLFDLVIRSTREDVRNYFHIGVIGYGSQVGSALRGALTGDFLYPLKQIADNPLRVEERVKRSLDGAGGILEERVKIPVWFEAVADGTTPMGAAFSLAANLLSDFVGRFPNCFPPIVLNLTDGEADDYPIAAAEGLKAIRSTDGNVLLFNLHLSSNPATPIEFPNEELGLPDLYARQLFHMSSFLPQKMLDAAMRAQFPVNQKTRGFIFNADAVSLIRFLAWGTEIKPAD
jgi:hypothetical protein